jgi:hypothetical protein
MNESHANSHRAPENLPPGVAVAQHVRELHPGRYPARLSPRQVIVKALARGHLYPDGQYDDAFNQVIREVMEIS